MREPGLHIRDILARGRPAFSFEFFPPASDADAAALLGALRDLEPLKPSFVSVTYGAGGSTRERTHALVEQIRSSTALEVVPHLTCVRHSEDDIRGVLDRYAALGAADILALAGDPPKDDPSFDRSKERLRHAADLVRLVRAHPGPAGAGFGVGVAGFPEGHPATPNRLVEMDHLKAKVDAGADWICTQMFFDNRDFYDFRERCGLAGVRVPILAGIMPITSEKTLMRMADLAAGARFPAALLRAIRRCAGDPEAVRRVGVHWAAEQCRDLLDRGVAGIHLYTLNRSPATREVYASLGLRDSLGAQV